ncbi:MAG: SIMPL domain-containing protein [Thermodesulfobacteriota bacterium]
MTKNILYTLLFALIVLSLNSSACAQQNNNQRTLNVNGTGEVKAKPDVAYINISVVTRSDKAEAALKENAVKTTNVLNKIKSIIGKKDSVKTSNFNLSPVYEYDQTTRKSFLTGYTATNDLIVETRNLDNLGNLIDATTTLGANRISGPTFDISNREEYKRQALKAAIEDAKSTAKVVAESAGVDLVHITHISPSYSFPGPVYARGEAKMLIDQASTPIESGDIKVSANVSITYEIK